MGGWNPYNPAIEKSPQLLLRGFVFYNLVEDYTSAALETGRIAAGQRIILNHIASMGRVDKLIVANIDTHVADRRRAAAEEYQIAGQKLFQGDTRRSIILRLCYTRDRADRVSEHIRSKAGAVKSGCNGGTCGKKPICRFASTGFWLILIPFI